MKAKRTMRLRPSLILLLMSGVSSLVMGSPVFAGEPIKAQIEFSRSLPALGDEFKEGAQFQLQTAKKDGQALKWRRVPKWLAGVWHTEVTTRKVFGIPVSYASKSDFISGYQADAKGHVWHPIIDRVTRVDCGSYYEYQLPQEESFEVDRGSSTRFSRSTRIRVDKTNGRIVVSFQQEDKAVTRPVEEGIVKVTADCCVFDFSGRKVTEQTIYVVQERVAPFHTIDIHGGIDFVASLNEHLKSEGKTDLIAPSREPVSPDQLQAKVLANEDRNSKLMEGIAER